MKYGCRIGVHDFEIIGTYLVGDISESLFAVKTDEVCVRRGCYKKKMNATKWKKGEAKPQIKYRDRTNEAKRKAVEGGEK